MRRKGESKKRIISDFINAFFSHNRFPSLILGHTGVGGVSRFRRLDLTDMAVRDKVLRANNDDELKNIFYTNGI